MSDSSHGTAWLLYHENGGLLFFVFFIASIVTGVGFWALSYQYGYAVGESFAAVSGLVFLVGGFVWFERIRAGATGEAHMELNVSGHAAKDVWYESGPTREGETLFHVDNFMDCPKCRYQMPEISPDPMKCPKCGTYMVLDNYGLAWARVLPLIGEYDFSDVWPDAKMDAARFITLYYFGEWTDRVGRGPVVVIKETLPFTNKLSEKLYVRPVISPLPEQIEEKFGPMPHFQVVLTSYGDAEEDMEEFNRASREIAARKALKRMGVALPPGAKAWEHLKLMKRDPAEAVRALSEQRQA